MNHPSHRIFGGQIQCNLGAEAETTDDNRFSLSQIMNKFFFDILEKVFKIYIIEVLYVCPVSGEVNNSHTGPELVVQTLW